MDDKNTLGVRMLVVALVLGVLGDTLLRAGPWGINFALWALMLGAFVAALSWRTRAFEHGGYGLLVPVLLCAVTSAWHDSGTLKLLNVLGLLVTFSILMFRAQGGSVLGASLTQYVMGSVIAGLNACVGPFVLLLGEIKWKEMSSDRPSRNSLALGRGLLLAVPPMLVFGGLLISADAVFEGWVTRIFQINFMTLLSHTFLTLFFAWIVSGYSRGLLMGREFAWTTGQRLPSLSLGIVETGVILGSLNLLFLTFVLVQFRYFFGGASLVQVTPGLTYAEYARRGFFELLTVATLVLPLLLLLHWLQRKDSPTSARAFRLLAGTQLVLLAVIMVSAFQRMRLYQREYGLTEQRLYLTAFMGWLAVVFVWFALTVLRGERERFAFGALVAGYVLIATLQALNPDAFIVRVNAARAVEGRNFDVWYATSLSGDAVPELIASLPSLAPKDRCVAATRILRGWPPSHSSDWRTWSVALARAFAAVEKNFTSLQAVACPDSAQRDSSGD